MCRYRNSRYRAQERARGHSRLCAGTQEGSDLLDTEAERLQEQLADPLFQLLVCHTIFCRQIEESFTRFPKSIGPQHRAMRTPSPTHDSPFLG